MSACRDVCVHGNFLGRGIPERGDGRGPPDLRVQDALPQVIFVVLGISSKISLGE